MDFKMTPVNKKLLWELVDYCQRLCSQTVCNGSVSSDYAVKVLRMSFGTKLN